MKTHLKMVVGLFRGLNVAQKITVTCLALTLLIQCYNFYLMHRLSVLREERIEVMSRGVSAPRPQFVAPFEPKTTAEFTTKY